MAKAIDSNLHGKILTLNNVAQTRMTKRSITLNY